MPEVWYRNKQFGAYLFDLVRNDDGSFVSICVGPVTQDTRPVESLPTPSQTMHFKIPSNTDPTREYTVTFYPGSGQLTCECDGFGWRHKCSHCDTVREAIEEARKHAT